jgi:N-formylmaleamate deformylase
MRTALILVLACLALPLTAQGQAPEPRTFVAEVRGEGPPMILLPGLTSPGAVWNHTIQHYESRYTLHVLTLAGFAGVPPVTEPSLARVKDELIEYIRTRRLERPVLVGHSLGGHLAYAVAAAVPDLIRAVVAVEGATYLPALFDPNATLEVWGPRAQAMRQSIAASDPETFRRQSDAQLMAQVGNPEARAWLEPIAAQSDPATTAQYMYDLYTSDLRDVVSRITAPVLLVMGTASIPLEGRPGYVASAERQLAGIPQVEVVEVPTAYHFVQLDDPEALHRAMDAFLDRVP